MKQPQLLKLAQETITWRTLLLNKLTVLLIVVMIIAVPLQVYATSNGDGHIQGKVVDADGNPVENATVIIQIIPLEGVVKSQTTMTDENGEFEFKNQTDLLEYRIVVEKEGVGSTQNRGQLLFPGENRYFRIVLDEE